MDQFKKLWHLSHMRAVKDQARLHIRTVSPEPLQITLKIRDVDKGSAKLISQFRKVRYLAHM